MPLARTLTSVDYGDCWAPYAPADLNRSLYIAPSGCSMSYRMNMTIHDPQSFYSSDKDANRKKGSRISRALKELWNVSRNPSSANKKEAKDALNTSMSNPYREPSPIKKRRGSSVIGMPPAPGLFYSPSTVVTGPNPHRYYQRTASADTAMLVNPTDESRRRHAAAPVRIESFAVPVPRVVQFRRARSGRRERAVPQMGLARIQPQYDAFVNSHEWTLSRGITELHLGVIGLTGSGRTTLIHRYLTEKFDPVESAEGGRYKNEFIQDGQSHLLLIRDEGDARPGSQFANWVDAVIFVYAVDNAETFQRIQDIFYDLTKYRNLSDMPLMLVGTKDTHNEMRVITEEQGRQMANRLKRCAFYETNSVSGSNVEKVFRDVCARIIHHRRYSLGGPRTPTPTTPAREADRRDYQDSRMFSNVAVIGSAPAKGQYHQRSTSYAAHEGTNRSRASSNHVNHRETSMIQGRVGDRAVSAAYPAGNFSLSNHFAPRSSQMAMADFCGVSPSSSQKSIGSLSNGLHTRSSTALIDTSVDAFATGDAVSIGTIGGLSAASASTSHLPTPSSTPTTQRKNRRISNIFQRPKENNDEKTKAIEALNHGVGRAIPIKQGHLYKKTTKSALNREWKKKYVCLYSDGRLSYHQSLKDYMDKSTGKEVFLGLATVKVAGRAVPRNTQRMGQSQTEESSSSLACSLSGSTTERKIEGGGLIGSGEGTSGGGSDDAKEKDTSLLNMMTPQTVPGQKKRRGAHRRLGSSGKHADEDEECFEILTSDQKRWEFCAMSAEERDEWVCAIEEQIEKALQNQLSTPSNRAHGNRDEVQALRNISGNSKCADCSSLHPDWASLNLGTLICIECSGVHRNLGSHVSRVRSLELDDWPVECLAVMQAIGNEAANKLWEFNAPLERKPNSESSREQKEQWIRSKYELKRFLPPLRVDETVSRQLISAVLARDVTTASLLLARASIEDVNCPLKDGRTPLHLAASIGSLEMVQLLLWNNADMLLLDEEGRSCLWHAKHQGSTECAELLVTAGMTPGYGCPSTAHTNHQQMMIPDGAIMGSMTNRDYSCYEEGVRMRNPVVSMNSKRNDAFDFLPASII